MGSAEWLSVGPRRLLLSSRGASCGRGVDSQRRYAVAWLIYFVSVWIDWSHLHPCSVHPWHWRERCKEGGREGERERGEGGNSEVPIQTQCKKTALRFIENGAKDYSESASYHSESDSSELPSDSNT